QTPPTSSVPAGQARPRASAPGIAAMRATNDRPSITASIFLIMRLTSFLAPSLAQFQSQSANVPKKSVSGPRRGPPRQARADAFDPIERSRSDVSLRISRRLPVRGGLRSTPRPTSTNGQARENERCGVGELRRGETTNHREFSGRSERHRFNVATSREYWWETLGQSPRIGEDPRREFIRRSWAERRAGVATRRTESVAVAR